MPPSNAVHRGDPTVLPLLAHLLAQPPARRELLIRNHRRFRNPGLARLLAERSYGLRHEDPSQMRELAELAAVVAEALDPQRVGRRELADLEALAQAHRGNALRVSEEFAAAEAALARAAARLSQGSGDPLLAARVLELTASLQADQGRAWEAAALLEEVVRIYRAAGDGEQTGRALIQMGLFIGYGGDPGEAIRLTTDGLRRLRGRRNGMARAALHNLALFYLQDGQAGPAEQILQEMMVLGPREDRQPVNRLKRHWLLGKVALRLGDLGRAAVFLAQAREGFCALGLPYRACRVALDLAAVWAVQGRSKSARAQVQKVRRMVAGLAVAPEAAQALELLDQVLAAGAGDPALFERAGELLGAPRASGAAG